MKDTKVMEPSELPHYENPRGLPPKWIEQYLQRDKSQLALDVMRAFDQSYCLTRKLEQANTKIWVLMLVVGGQATVIGLLAKVLIPLLAHVK